MTIIWIASLIALALGGVCLRVLRKLIRPQIFAEATDLAWQVGSPIDRLLDPAEFEFLRSREIVGLIARCEGQRSFVRRTTGHAAS